MSVMALLKKACSHHKDTKNTKTVLILTHKDDSLETIICSVISVISVAGCFFQGTLFLDLSNSN